MDYDKLIHCLKCCARVDAQNMGCDDCDLEYCGGECQQLCGTAATASETLRADLSRVTAERDTAVDELRGKCSVCSHYTPYHNDGPCASCKFEVACFVPEKATDKWEWRGIREEE